MMNDRTKRKSCFGSLTLSIVDGIPQYDAV